MDEPKLRQYKLKQYTKVQAHCRECKNCHYDIFFRGLWCIKKNACVQLIDFACKDFYYIFAANYPDWAEQFIFGAKRTW